MKVIKDFKIMSNIELNNIAKNLFNSMFAKTKFNNDFYDFIKIQFESNLDRLAYIECVGHNKYVISISDILNKECLKDIIIKIIAHEYCHYFQFKTCFDMNLIKFVDNQVKRTADDNEADSLLITNNGHNAYFKVAAQTIGNSNLNFNILDGLTLDDKRKIMQVCDVTIDDLDYLLEKYMYTEFKFKVLNEFQYTITVPKLYESAKKDYSKFNNFIVVMPSRLS